ncbi:hypothetical protein Unana1_08322 [Umbelopsis nana]
MDSPGLFINGAWIAAEAQATFNSNNPATDTVVGIVPEASTQQIEDAVQAAHSAFATWGETPGIERAQYLLMTAKKFEESQAEMVDLLIAETGSSYTKAMFELQFAVQYLKSASADFRFGNGEVFSSDDGTLRFAAANLPNGVLNLVTGHGDVGKALIDHPLVKAVSFTGSTATGKKIAAQAGGLLKRCVLELGGKDALIILDDIDLDFAVNATAFSGLFHQGQICMSAERLLVHSSIANEFAERLVKKVQSLKIGNPSDHSVQLGPMMSERQLNIVEDHVDDAKRLGAKVLCGGACTTGLFYPPTVMTGITTDMKVFQEETFGPVLPIITFDTIDDAISIANNCQYGLSGGVLTNNMEMAFHITNRLDTGMVHIGNGTVMDDPCGCAFGGVKNSGLGRESGKYSYEALTELKWVTVHHKKPGFPF